LDNRDEIIRLLADSLSLRSSDVEIVAASFECWGTDCFARLLGDWAVAIWIERDRKLILARDFMGIRPLYYQIEKEQVTWSSVLDPMLVPGKTFALDHEYIAAWLELYPAADATPFAGIRAVPPSSYVTIGTGTVTITPYWDFDPVKRITYGTDRDYEQHFRVAFQEAVRRRLRSDHPICAELSGGMDSPSIVCVADQIAQSSSEIPAIHTLSFYDDSEPHADERPYFSKVEEKLGRVGCHIDLKNQELFRFDRTDRLISMPGCLSGRTKEFNAKLTGFFQSNQIRVVLSGIGGDEMMGGIPSPIPELQDLLVQFRLRHFAHKLKLWSLNKRVPWFHLFGETIGGFLPVESLRQRARLRAATWLRNDYFKRHTTDPASSGIVRFVGPLPSFQAKLGAVDVLRRQLATKSLPADVPHERRYPFLDRTLLEFLFAIPREQFVRPGQRRSLMRRALAGIVPAEILERRRKAYVNRGPRVAIAKEWPSLCSLSQNMVAAQLGIVDESSFRDALAKIQNSDQVPMIRLMRTVSLEAWLRHLFGRGVLGALDVQHLNDLDRASSRLMAQS
jgi:asparagine synthase (glutamine-hydrolysing)